MGTLMACVVVQAAEPGASCQMVSVVRSTASASSSAPAGPGARVAVPGGSAGSARHVAPGPAIALAAAAVQHDRGGAAGPEGCRGQRRAVQPERR